MSSSFGMKDPTRTGRSGETWITRLTYEDGRTEEVESVTGEDGHFTVTIPAGATSAGPSWRPGYEGDDCLPGGAVAPVTFMILTVGGGSGGTAADEVSQADLDAAMHTAGAWHLLGMDWTSALAVAADEMCQDITGLVQRSGQWIVGREWTAAADGADILAAYVDHLAHRGCPELLCRRWSVDPVSQAGRDVAMRLAASWYAAAVNHLGAPTVSVDEVHLMLARAASW